jgi:predicted deacetylase
MNRLVVSLHDVAPATSTASRRWLDIVERHGMRATLLVVPGPWRGARLAADPGFAAWLREVAARGHELALHGWEHRAVIDPHGDPARAGRRYRLVGDLLARGCQEFWQLGRAEADRRIGAGLDVLADAGITPVGFTPPGWLASAETLGALHARGFEWTTTQWSVLDLRGGRAHTIAALSQRPGSVLSGPAAAANHWVAARRMAAGRPLRLALHPDDLGDHRLVRATVRTLGEAVSAGVTACTYGDIVRSSRPLSPVEVGA